MNFHPDHKQQNVWWENPLIAYKEYDAQKNAMEQIYSATGVSTCKLTHIVHTLVVQHAGSEGLASWLIKTTTRDILGKNSAYQSEVDKMTMKVMVGFSQDKSYVVNHTFIDLLLPINQLCHLLILKLGEWQMQMTESPLGNKTTCCRTKFLWEILPFLVEILVQDDNYLSLYLQVKNIPVPSFFFVQSTTHFVIYCTLLGQRIKL
jgi:hypothetical protein